ncbi:hypothetical protein Scep_001233 [Stephania cephalantha]|uniref:Uncharacterized protein n=1 Tax=Stephania cephalantha TaxID=152367 RepID=A0AAP0Q358_9MAGN
MNNNNNKVHSHGNVPFSWENKPGISKVANQEDWPTEVLLKLPPPPCLMFSKDGPNNIVGHELHIPLPPCPFQPATIRSSSRKGPRRHDQDDPFFAAYRECTKSVKHGGEKKRSGGSRFFSFSCKNSCGVRDEGLVKMPLPRSSSVPSEKIWMQNGKNEVFFL